jgi:hypothetical protein
MRHMVINFVRTVLRNNVEKPEHHQKLVLLLLSLFLSVIQIIYLYFLRKEQKSRHYKLTGKAAYIKRQRLIGRSKNSLSKEFGVTWTTLNNFMHSKSIA